LGLVERVPVDRANVRLRCEGRPCRGAEVGAGARVPMGLVDLCQRRWRRAPGGVAVDAGPRVHGKAVHVEQSDKM